MKKLLLLAALATLPMATMADTDPNGKTLSGMGKERLTVEGCGTGTNVTRVESLPQGVDTFNITHQTVTVGGVVNLPLTGTYSHTDGTTYLQLDTNGRLTLQQYLQETINTDCGKQPPFDGRAMSVVRNTIKNGRGELLVKVEFTDTNGKLIQVNYSLKTVLFYN